MTAIFGAFGFLVAHLQSIDSTQAIMIGVGLAILAILFLGSATYLKKLMDELENL